MARRQPTEIRLDEYGDQDPRLVGLVRANRYTTMGAAYRTITPRRGRT